MARTVRIVGDPETYEVLCESPTAKLLVNPAAKLRQQVAELEGQLAAIRARLDGTATPRVDLNRHSIDGP